MKTAQLRNRIILYFVGSTLLTSLLFGVTSFLFAYNIEDQFFYDLLKDEALLAEVQLKNGQTPQPKLTFISYAAEPSALPASIKQRLQEEPERVEFSGEDEQHFHLMKLSHGFLIAQVSDHLVVRKIKEGMFYFLLIVFAVAATLAMVMGFASYKIAKRLLKPLDNLMVILNNAPVDKLPQGFAKHFKNDEIGTFATTLEAALARIRAFITREQNFTRDVSHELRTPVTVSQGALTLLKQTALDEQQQSLVTRIDSAQQQIEQSLSLLLALAREDNLGHGKAKLLSAIEQSVLQQYEHLAGKSIDLKIEVAKDAEVSISQTSLLILLNNLLGNAFKYTVEGEIHITYKAETLCIQDTGVGIAQHIQQQVFDAGIKGQQSQGLGMGLNIVKRLCEQLELGYTLASDDKGTRVEVVFAQ